MMRNDIKNLRFLIIRILESVRIRGRVIIVPRSRIVGITAPILVIHRSTLIFRNFYFKSVGFEVCPKIIFPFFLNILSCLCVLWLDRPEESKN